MDDAPKPFAKLFDTAEGQFLVTLVETDDEQPGVECRAADVNGVTAKITLSGWGDGEAGQERAFAMFDQERAEEGASMVRNIARRAVGEAA